MTRKTTPPASAADASHDLDGESGDDVQDQVGTEAVPTPGSSTADPTLTDRINQIKARGHVPTTTPDE